MRKMSTQKPENAQLMRDLMAENSLSTADVAEKLSEKISVSRATVSFWLNGRMSPRPTMRVLIDKIFEGKLPPDGWDNPKQKAKKAWLTK
jgi:transcriptional regulator with XRE-family HTH domain